MTYPFSGEIYFEPEYVYNAGLGNANASINPEVFSDKVQVVRIESGDVHKTLRGINGPNVCGFVKTGGDATLHLEWIWQPNSRTSLASYCAMRRTDETTLNSSGSVHSLAFGIQLGKSNASDTHYHLTGCVCKSITLSSSRGEEYIWSADFDVGTVATSTTSNAVSPASWSVNSANAYAGFNQAGSITFTGGYTAYITDSINVTINNNTTAYWDVGSTSKKACIAGALDITGSSDLSIDDGGGNAWDIIASKLTDITSLVIDTACTSGMDKLTLTTGKYDNISVEANTGNEGMIQSIPFTFKSAALST